MVNLPPSFLISLYSNQKKKILKRFSEDYINFDIQHEKIEPLKLWDISFGFPLFNAAGMFKKGESYYTIAKQGAGAYLSGTTTSSKRLGNFKNGVLHPFAPFPSSGASVNWMGLPNEGHQIVAKRLSQLQKIQNCPIGASLSASPEERGIEGLENLKIGMDLYKEANVDFIEINESCPNVEEGHQIDNNSLDEDLINRLEYISMNFLKNRDKNLPVIVKFSNDTDLSLVPNIIDNLISLGFDGVNFGNTSTKYEESIDMIKDKEKKLFQYFTENYGGGLSGKLLSTTSLNLVKTGSNHLKTKKLSKEFHIIRTGGVCSIEDIKNSLNNGASICQWYNGYFSEFSKYGHQVYNHFKKEYKSISQKA